jgi:heme/copper-type cytochrome/quinol oxidase subunit 2
MNLLRHIRMVLWSFFGIRRSARAAEDFAEIRPVTLVLTAVVVAAFIVMVLASVALFASLTATP